MDIEEIKEQLIENLTTYKERVQDSEVYIRLKEKYDTLNPNMQKGIISVSCFLLAWFVYSIPASYVNSADENMESFSEDRQMIRELIRAGRIERTLQKPPIPPTPAMLQSKIDQKMTDERILPEQKTSSTPVAEVAPKSIVPKSIKQQGLKTTFEKINLKQVVKMGEAFDNINSTKLLNLSIIADSKDPHYYNVDYEVASFSVVMPKAPVEKKSKKSKKRRKKSRFK